MSGSLLPIFVAKVGPEEGQLVEGGRNAVDSCGPASGAALMMMHGYGDPYEPQDWINQMPGYGPNYHGGTTLQALNNFIAGHYPNPPKMSIQQAGSTSGAVDFWMQRGNAMIAWVHCDSQANIKNYETGISHYVLPLAIDAASVTVWNPWGNGRLDKLARAYFDSASLRTVDLDERSFVAVPLGPPDAVFSAWVKRADRNDLRTAIHQGRYADVLGEYIVETHHDFWNRGDIQTARRNGQYPSTLVEFLREYDADFIKRGDVQSTIGRHDYSGVVSEFVQENAA